MTSSVSMRGAYRLVDIWLTLLSSSGLVLAISSFGIVSTWRSLVPGHLFGGALHSMALCPGLPQ
jgi:hypothetical protein